VSDRKRHKTDRRGIYYRFDAEEHLGTSPPHEQRQSRPPRLHALGRACGRGRDMADVDPVNGALKAVQ